MKFFGIDLAPAARFLRGLATVGSRVSAPGSGGWFSIIRESFAGAWQRNEELTGQTALSYAAVFACTTLIASDIGKLRLRLVENIGGIWSEVTSPAFSPVLRKPNRYQIINKLIEQWIVSKLTFGNAYVLKQRDDRRIVVALYVLDPQQVTPLIAPDGAVYYQLGKSDLAGIPEEDPGRPGAPIVVPASEIIHDLMVPLFHPLIGVTPIYACGLIALQGMKIQANSTAFFANGSNPGGVLTAPGSIDQPSADRMKKDWEEKFSGPNAGKVAVLGDGLKYEPLAVNAVDSQLIEQLKWTVEQVCSCYHVPAALIDSSHQPPYANSEPLVQQYYSQCLQTLIVCLENSLDDGLGLPAVADHVYGTEFDIDDLIWMDSTTRTKVATDAIVGGALSPNESRAKYFGVGAKPGGDSPYLQQQMVSIEALSKRDSTDWLLPKPPPQPAIPSGVPDDPADPDDLDDLDLNALTAALVRGAHTEGWLTHV